MTTDDEESGGAAEPGENKGAGVFSGENELQGGSIENKYPEKQTNVVKRNQRHITAKYNE